MLLESTQSLYVVYTFHQLSLALFLTTGAVCA